MCLMKMLMDEEKNILLKFLKVCMTKYQFKEIKILDFERKNTYD